MKGDKDQFLTHPIIGSPSMKRVLEMTEAEKRLLDNAKKGLADCDESIGTERMQDRCIDALFKGLEAARKLRKMLSEHASKDLNHNNRDDFIALLETSIPPAETSGTILVVPNSETGDSRKLSVSQLIYQMRCIYVHENDNLDEAERSPHPIKLRWGTPMNEFFLYDNNGLVIVNAPLLLNRLREVLSHFITSLEAMISFANTGRASITIIPPLGSIQPTTRKPW